MAHLDLVDRDDSQHRHAALNAAYIFLPGAAPALMMETDRAPAARMEVPSSSGPDFDTIAQPAH